jgi:hypothetical protein
MVDICLIAGFDPGRPMTESRTPNLSARIAAMWAIAEDTELSKQLRQRAAHALDLLKAMQATFAADDQDSK